MINIMKDSGGFRMKAYANGDIHPRVTVGANAMYPSYIVSGNTRSVMIDAGINFFGPLYIKSLTNALGDYSRLTYLFLTHSHYDHLGSAFYLKRKITGLQIGANPRVGEIIRKESVLNRMRFLGDLQYELFKDIVGDEDVTLQPFALDIQLKDGDTFDLGGLSCVVYAVPGHTQDSMAYYFPEIRVLVPGEAFGHVEGREGDMVQAEFLSSFDDYIGSMDRLSVLDVETLCLAHGWYLTGDDIAPFMKEARRVALDHRDMILHYLEETAFDMEKTVELIAKKEYDERPGMFQERNAYMANLTAQVRLLGSHGVSNTVRTG